MSEQYAKALDQANQTIADLRQQVAACTAKMDDARAYWTARCEKAEADRDASDAMVKHNARIVEEQGRFTADLRQQVERWTQMHYDEMQRHTETSVKLSTAEAQLTAEREAVRVLGRAYAYWTRWLGEDLPIESRRMIDMVRSNELAAAAVEKETQ